MAGKTTSAAYRLPVSSEYHTKCIAESVKKIRESERSNRPSKAFSQGEYRKCNVVAQENIWKEHVANELKAKRDWDENWSFLLEYDSEGKPQQKMKLPENLSLYNSKVSVTTSQHFGKWASRPESIEMRRLEKMISRNKRTTDLKNYDTN